MPEQVTMDTMRHEAAVMSARVMTDNLHQIVDDLQTRLTIAKVDLGNAYNAAYYKALDTLKSKNE